MKKDILFFIWISIWGITGLSILFFSNGTGDNGDGIMHYLFARYAHLHLENFLDPWAKTGYVLIVWPFAQFGLKGVMLLNMICAGICQWLVYKICQSLKISFPWISFIILAIGTWYFKLMFSGLTEHLFSLVLILSVWFFIKNKWILGTIILSALPFFRQEGYIIIGAMLPFFMYQHKLKLIPLLSFSFILIGVIGGIYYRDIFWIIHSNPYKYNLTYGRGYWWSFCRHLYYNVGLINLIFFIAGSAGLLFTFFKSRLKKEATIFYLIFLPFAVFFIAHSVFWYLGIFHSLGLQRVLNCIMPLFAIIAAYGFSFIIDLFPKTSIKKGLVGFFVVCLMVYPFTPSPPNINFRKDFLQTPFEKDMLDICRSIKTNYPGSYFYYGHSLIPYYLQVDPFDPNKSELLYLLDLDSPKPGSILLWENGLTTDQSGYTEHAISNHSQFIKIKELDNPNEGYKIVIYKTIN